MKCCNKIDYFSLFLLSFISFLIRGTRQFLDVGKSAPQPFKSIQCRHAGILVLIGTLVFYLLKLLCFFVSYNIVAFVTPH